MPRKVALLGGAVGAVGAGVGLGARVGLVVFAQFSDGAFNDFATLWTLVLTRSDLTHLEVQRILWWHLDGACRCSSVHCCWGLVHACKTPAGDWAHINRAWITL